MTTRQNKRLPIRRRELNNQEKGYLSIIISCVLFTIICIDFWVRMRLDINFIQYTPIIQYDFSLLMEKYAFYGVIISMQIGWTYLYGDIEKDFNKIMAITFILLALMDMQGVINLVKFINSSFYILKDMII
jgi:hypothetical protein